MCQSEVSRETEPIEDLYLYHLYIYRSMREIKKRAPMIMVAGKSKICSVGQQPGDPGKPRVHRKSGDTLVQNSLMLWEVGLFVLFRTSADWTRSTHNMELNLPFSKFIDLNINLIQYGWRLYLRLWERKHVKWRKCIIKY